MSLNRTDQSNEKSQHQSEKSDKEKRMPINLLNLNNIITENRALQNLMKTREKFTKAKQSLSKDSNKEKESNNDYKDKDVKDNKDNYFKEKESNEKNYRPGSESSKESNQNRNIVNNQVYKKKLPLPPNLTERTERSEGSEKSDIVPILSTAHDEAYEPPINTYNHKKQISDEIQRSSRVKKSIKYSSSNLTDLNKIMNVHNRQGSQPPSDGYNTKSVSPVQKQSNKSNRSDKSNNESFEANPIKNNYLSSVNRNVNISPSENYSGNQKPKNASKKQQFKFVEADDKTDEEVKELKELVKEKIFEKKPSYLKKPSYDFKDPLLNTLNKNPLIPKAKKPNQFSLQNAVENLEKMKKDETRGYDENPVKNNKNKVLTVVESGHNAQPSIASLVSLNIQKSSKNLEKVGVRSNTSDKMKSTHQLKDFTRALHHERVMSETPDINNSNYPMNLNYPITFPMSFDNYDGIENITTEFKEVTSYDNNSYYVSNTLPVNKLNKNKVPIPVHPSHPSNPQAKLQVQQKQERESNFSTYNSRRAPAENPNPITKADVAKIYANISPLQSYKKNISITESNLFNDKYPNLSANINASGFNTYSNKKAKDEDHHPVSTSAAYNRKILFTDSTVKSSDDIDNNKYSNIITKTITFNTEGTEGTPREDAKKEDKRKVYYLDLIKDEKHYLNDVKDYKDRISELLQFDYKLRVDSPSKINWQLTKQKDTGSPGGTSRSPRGEEKKEHLKSSFKKDGKTYSTRNHLPKVVEKLNFEKVQECVNESRDEFNTARSEVDEVELKLRKEELDKYNRNLFLYILKSKYYRKLDNYLEINADLLKQLRKRYYRNRTYAYWFYNTPRRYIKKTKKKSLHFFVENYNNNMKLIKVFDDRRGPNFHKKRGIISLNDNPEVIDDLGDNAVDIEKENAKLEFKLKCESKEYRKYSALKIQRFFRANVLRDKMNNYNSVYVLMEYANKQTQKVVLRESLHFFNTIKQDYLEFIDEVLKVKKEVSARKIQNAFKESNAFNNFKKYLNKYNIKAQAQNEIKNKVFKVTKQKPLVMKKTRKIHPHKAATYIQKNIRMLLGRVKYLNLIDEQQRKYDENELRMQQFEESVIEDESKKDKIKEKGQKVFIKTLDNIIKNNKLQKLKDAFRTIMAKVVKESFFKYKSKCEQPVFQHNTTKIVFDFSKRHMPRSILQVTSGLIDIKEGSFQPKTQKKQKEEKNLFINILIKVLKVLVLNRIKPAYEKLNYYVDNINQFNDREEAIQYTYGRLENKVANGRLNLLKYTFRKIENKSFENMEYGYSGMTDQGRTFAYEENSISTEYHKIHHPKSLFQVAELLKRLANHYKGDKPEISQAKINNIKNNVFMQILKDIFLRKKKTIYNQLTFFLLNKSIIEEKEKALKLIFDTIDNKLSLEKNLTTLYCFKKIIDKASSTTLFNYSALVDQSIQYTSISYSDSTSDSFHFKKTHQILSPILVLASQKKFGNKKDEKVKALQIQTLLIILKDLVLKKRKLYFNLFNSNSVESKAVPLVRTLSKCQRNLSFRKFCHNAMKLPSQRIIKKQSPFSEFSRQSYFTIQKHYSVSFKQSRKIIKLQKMVRSKLARKQIIQFVEKNNDELSKPGLMAALFIKLYKNHCSDKLTKIVRAFRRYMKSKPKQVIWDIKKLRRPECYSKNVTSKKITSTINKIIGLFRRFIILNKIIFKFKFKFMRTKRGKIITREPPVKKINAVRYMESAIKIQRKYRNFMAKDLEIQERENKEMDNDKEIKESNEISVNKSHSAQAEAPIVTQSKKGKASGVAHASAGGPEIEIDTRVKSNENKQSKVNESDKTINPIIDLVKKDNKENKKAEIVEPVDPTKSKVTTNAGRRKSLQENQIPIKGNETITTDSQSLTGLTTKQIGIGLIGFFAIYIILKFFAK